MRVLRLAAVLTALGAVLGGASSARADVKVPKALAGVELHEGATKVEIDRSVKRLGGREVIVFRTRYDVGVSAHMVTEEDQGVELAIVDAETKLPLFREVVRSTYRRSVTDVEPTIGSFVYRVSWKDHDGDGEDELVLSLAKSSGHGPPVAHRTRIWQVRFGLLSEVNQEVAGCPRAPEDDGTFDGDWAIWAERRRAAVARFVESVDMGAKQTQIRCNLGNALVASHWPAHDDLAPLGEILAAPVAVDCPGLAWAERRGAKLQPRRSYVFVSQGGVVVVAVEDDIIRSAVVATSAGLTGNSDATASIAWSELWIIDEHVWFIAELELSSPDRGAQRYAVVYEPLQRRVDQQHELAEYQTARLVHRTAEHGLFELIVATSESQKTVWRKEAASRWERAPGAPQPVFPRRPRRARLHRLRTNQLAPRRPEKTRSRLPRSAESGPGGSA